MSEGSRPDRRTFLKHAAGAAWAAPLILTISARAAQAQVQSCLPSLTVCGVPNGSGGCDTTGFASCCGGMTCQAFVGGTICRCS